MQRSIIAGQLRLFPGDSDIARSADNVRRVPEADPRPCLRSKAIFLAATELKATRNIRHDMVSARALQRQIGLDSKRGYERERS
jgi:hypothetical protein